MVVSPRSPNQPVDLIQAYATWRPVPHGETRFSVRAGLYWPEISLEHQGPAWQVADMGAPSIALGEAIGRWGCFAAGCCYGKPSDGPFQVTFTDPFAHEAVGTPLNVPLHPTQLYLSANAFLVFLILQWAYRRRTFDGEVFWLYVLLYSITRGIIEVWRGDLVRGFVIPGVLSTSQFIGVLTALASLGMLFYLSRRSRAEA